jgi:type II secretory pathway component GspD/PulD (secretin)
VASNIVQGGLQTNSVELENVGLILGVTPRISPDGTVVMEIDAEKSALGPEQEGIPITVSLDGTIIRSPRIDTTTAQATVSAASGETIILGGLITNRREAIDRRVPYLSDIPLLGNLFRYDGMFERRTELLIILTPHVIRSPEDAERLQQTEMARMSWCTADVYRVHGDVNAAPAPIPELNQPTQVIYPDIDPRGEGLAPPEPNEPEAPSELPEPSTAEP